jgi:ATP-binding cassette subfamily F protein uup
LSGGERNRLLLAKLFARPANLLVLDEPTNDLDLDTLELLEERVADFDGTLLLVSHDRAFLDRVVTSLLVLEGDGHVQEFIGGWSDYAIWRRERQRTTVPPRETASSRESAVAARTKESMPSRSRRLSFKEQREFDSLPATIESLETDKAEIERVVADPAFYQRSQDEVRGALTRLQHLGAEIDAAYARWAELEALRG